MKATTQFEFEKDATVGDLNYALVERHPEDRVKIVTYMNGSPKSIRIICDHQETTQ